MKEDSPDGLVAKALGGDADAFCQLIGPLLGPSYRLAVTMLGDPTEAEDVVQEACLTAWRKLGNLRPGSELKPWFLAVVGNRCRSARRSRWWNVLRFADVPPRSDAARRDPETHAALAMAFDRLRPQERLVLSLFYGLDLTTTELAATLGCSQPAAKARLYRAVAALRPHMSAREAIGDSAV